MTACTDFQFYRKSKILKPQSWQESSVDLNTSRTELVIIESNIVVFIHAATSMFTNSVIIIL